MLSFHQGCLVVAFYVTANGGCGGSFLNCPFRLLAYAESTAAIFTLQSIYAAVSAEYHGFWCVYTERVTQQLIVDD